MLHGLSKWKVLNSKEVRAIGGMVKEQWGADFPSDVGVLQGSTGDIFLISRAVEKVDLERIRIDSLGLYFGELRNEELRLSIEGSQLVGKSGTRNVVELTGDELRQWLQGSTIGRQPEGCSGYVIVRHGPDFIGCGRCKSGVILNFVPKARRIMNF